MAPGSIRVLYIDGDPDMTDLAETMLGRHADIEVVTTTEPTAVPERITDGRYDCIVSEYELPRRTGLELYEQVDSRVGHFGVPYILFTEKGSEEVAADALNAGISGYIRKGGDDQYTRLTDCIRNVAGQTQSQTGLADLHETARELMAAESETAVFDIGVTAARDILGCELSACYRYDTEADTFAVVADTGIATADSDAAFELCRRTLDTGEPIVSDDPTALGWEPEPETVLALPVGDDSVLLVGSTVRTDEPDRSLADVLAGHLTAMLNHVQREQSLARRNERLDEFASVISHELRNPLDFAVAHRELAAEKYGADDHLEQIHTAHSRMASLIEDILLWAREGIDISLNESVSIASVTLDSWETIQSDSATLTVDTDRTVFADRDRLKQLFDNLFQNAIDHAGDSATIRVGDLDADGIFVADDGPGIPAAEQESVFESGYTLSTKGTGIGLALVRQIVEAHGWEIELTDGATGGARFEIRFDPDG